MDKFLDWMYKYGWVVQTVIATLTLISTIITTINLFEMSDCLLKTEHKLEYQCQN